MFFFGFPSLTLMSSSQQAKIPRSSYYVGPPPVGSAFGTNPVGEIGVHFPREIVRIERDYTAGELVQYVFHLYPILPFLPLTYPDSILHIRLNSRDVLRPPNSNKPSMKSMKSLSRHIVYELVHWNMY